MPAEPSRLRADARGNRLRILDAAREAFTTRGEDVPVAAIARRAGVGVATVYRHFPTRRDLITAMLEQQITRCLAVVDDGLADPDPWRGFRVVLEKLSAMQVTGPGLTEGVLAEFGGSPEFERRRERAERDFAELVRRAKATGHLRPDFDRADLTLLMMTSSGITATSPDAALAASRRLVGLLLGSFQSGLPLPPPAPLGLYGVCGAR